MATDTSSGIGILTAMRRLFRVSRVVKGYRMTCSRGCRPCALSFCFADSLEVRDWDQSASIRYQRIARFVPIGIIFSAYYVEEIAFGKAQLLIIARVWIVVVECFDDLESKATVS